jgi:DNA end-binding protein Ku
VTARAMWKASLDLGGIQVPVKLYGAVEDRDLHFRLLHAKDSVPVKQRLVDPRTGEEVGPDAVQRGVALEAGVFILLKREELEAVSVQPSRAIEVMRFVPRAAIDYAWYSRPYFLGPDGAGAEYAALVAALRAAEVLGVARWAMRGKRYFGALEARDAHLALIAMRTADQVVAAAQLDLPSAAPVREAERALADQLIAALDANFDPAELKDEYRDRVLTMVAEKARGGRPHRVRREAAPESVTDLTRALKQSIQSVRNKTRAA